MGGDGTILEEVMAHLRDGRGLINMQACPVASSGQLEGDHLLQSQGLPCAWEP